MNSSYITSTFIVDTKDLKFTSRLRRQMMLNHNSDVFQKTGKQTFETLLKRKWGAFQKTNQEEVQAAFGKQNELFAVGMRRTEEETKAAIWTLRHLERGLWEYPEGADSGNSFFSSMARELHPNFIWPRSEKVYPSLVNSSMKRNKPQEVFVVFTQSHTEILVM